MEFLQLKETRRDDIMLLNIIYNQPSPQTNWVDSIDVVYKDLSTDEKHLETILNPTMDVYFTKPEYRNYEHPKYVLPVEQCEIKNISCKYATRDIAKTAGGKYEAYYRSCAESKNRKAMKNLHKYPYVLASDYDPESYYRIQFSCNYLNEKPKPITKLYSDIEVDGINVEGFVSDGVAPINAITLIDEKTRKCFTFALRNEKNPQIQELEDNLDLFKHECHKMFDESYGEFEYNIIFYDEKDELAMLKDYFKLIHTLKRDFIMFWNMNFDANYLMDRIKELGYDPRDFFCHPDFKEKRCYYYADKKNSRYKDAGNFLIEVFKNVYGYFEALVRDNHAKDSAKFIRERSNSLLSYLEPTLLSFVAKVSESHGYDVIDIYGLKSRAQDLQRLFLMQRK
mgnify:CR=1 FL=1